MLLAVSISAAGQWRHGPLRVVLRGVCAVCLVLGGLSVAALGQVGQGGRGEAALEKGADRPQVTHQQVANWIEQLDDDRFAVREAAQQHLASAGQVALGAVAEKAAEAEASLESSTRAVRILSDWGVGKDSALRIAALERLAALDNRPIEAAIAAGALAEVREVIAIEKIESLGGTCSPANPRLSNVNQIRITGGQSQDKSKGPLQVTIGPGWKGTDADLRWIAQIPRLHTVGFHSAPVGDGALEQVAELETLSRIEIYGTDLSPEAVEALRKRLPKTIQIDVRSGAQLGIGGSFAQGGAHVVFVMPGSAAEKADIQVRDIIKQIDGKPINDFKELTKQIAKHQPGDTVVLSIERAGKALDKKVTFDRWGDDLEMGKKKSEKGKAVGEKGQ